MTTLPNTCFLRQFDTHRLLPRAYSDEPSSALARIAENEVQLSEISELDGATNDQLFAENNLLPGIGTEELVFGVPHAHIINAAFIYAHVLGGRFNTPSRGAWYAAFEIETSQAEVAFHKTLYLAEVGLYHDTVIYVDYPQISQISQIKEGGQRDSPIDFFDPDEFLGLCNDVQLQPTKGVLILRLSRRFTYYECGTSWETMRRRRRPPGWAKPNCP